MRRPILGNGFPKVVPLLTANPDGLAVLNLQTLPAEAQDRVHLLTLFCVPADATPTTTISVLLQNELLGTALAISTLDISSGSLEFPYPLLTRFPVRGPQRVSVGLTVTPAAASDVRVYGYFELEATEIPDVQGIRPLQPSLPVKPFLAGARPFVGGGSPQTIHALSSDYVDQITLQAAIPGDMIASLQLQGETDFKLPHGSLTTVLMASIFDGIPMRSQYPLKITGTVALEPAWTAGSFKRD